MTDKSDSEESRKSIQKHPTVKEHSHKVFVTGLDGNARTGDLEDELRKEFSKYGKIDKLVVKRSIRSDYCFAFIDYERGTDSNEAVRNLDQMEIGGKKMKVEIQDDSRRRKDRPDGCYICGRPGHFARDCRDKDNDRPREDRRSRSRSRSTSKRRKHRSRSRKSKSKKQRRKRPRSRSNHRRKDKRDRRSSRSQST